MRPVRSKLPLEAALRCDTYITDRRPSRRKRSSPASVDRGTQESLIRARTRQSLHR